MNSATILKINRKVIAAILVIEFILCLAEAWRAINCYHAGGGCWIWFFAFAANIPASIIIESIRGYLLKVMLIDSIGIVTATSFFIYLIIGTLWWSIVSHSLIFFYKYTSRPIGDR